MKNDLKFWKVLSFVLTLVLIIPIGILLIYLFTPNSEFFKTIVENTLFSYIKNTLVLGLSSAFLAGVFGYSLAYLTTYYEFKFSKYLGFLLILPLSIPAYIAGYTYEGMLNYTGTVQSTLRDLSITVNQNWFDILSMQGAIFIFAITLYPYVYLISKSYLSKHTQGYIESAKTMGSSNLDILRKIILPLSRPALIGGVTLVLLEVLADYAVVTFFGIPTFTSAIFKTWYGLGEHDSAIKLALMAMFIVITILIIEKLLRGKKGYSNTTTVIKKIRKEKLTGWKNALASGYAILIFLLGFGFPVLQQLAWALRETDKFVSTGLFGLIATTVTVASIATVIIIVVSLIIANVLRLGNPMIKKFVSNALLLGYSMSGAIIALGVLIIFVFVDRNMVWFYRLFNPNSKTLLLTLSPVILVFAYTVRFLSVGFNNILSSFEKQGNKYHEASKTMGNNTTKTFFKVDLPMLKFTILNSFILVFIDIVKEVTITLKLRPFNYDTLATKVFQYATDEQIPVASYPSLVIIGICIIAIIVSNKVLRGRTYA